MVVCLPEVFCSEAFSQFSQPCSSPFWNPIVRFLLRLQKKERFLLLYQQLRSLLPVWYYWLDADVAPDAVVVFADFAAAFAVFAGFAEASAVAVDLAAVFVVAADFPAVVVSVVIVEASVDTAVPVQASAVVHPAAVVSAVTADLAAAFADIVVPVQVSVVVAVVVAAAVASAETVEPGLLSAYLLPVLMSLHFSQELLASYPGPAQLASCLYFLLS